MVYVPCEQAPANEEQELVIDLRQTADGRMALLVYSALDRLVNCCGSRQPWVVMPTARLDTFSDRFDLILLDVDIPHEHRRGGGRAR